jgi:hypothetical protein
VWGTAVNSSDLDPIVTCTVARTDCGVRGNRTELDCRASALCNMIADREVQLLITRISYHNMET